MSVKETTAEVLVIYTGGTIGMKPTPQGLQPVKGYLPEYLSQLPQFHDKQQASKLTTPLSRFGRRIHYVIKEWDELLDSSNRTYSLYLFLLYLLHHKIPLVTCLDTGYSRNFGFHLLSPAPRVFHDLPFILLEFMTLLVTLSTIWAESDHFHLFLACSQSITLSQDD